MSDEKLRKSLTKLKRIKEELDASEVDSREKLDTVIIDIERKLSGEEPSQPEKPLSSRLQDTVVHFEVKHPTITGILNDLSMTLSNMGL